MKYNIYITFINQFQETRFIFKIRSVYLRRLAASRYDLRRKQ